jgi:hypothetical protein
MWFVTFKSVSVRIVQHVIKVTMFNPYVVKCLFFTFLRFLCNHMRIGTTKTAWILFNYLFIF